MECNYFNKIAQNCTFEINYYERKKLKLKSIILIFAFFTILKKHIVTFKKKVLNKINEGRQLFCNSNCFKLAKDNVLKNIMVTKILINIDVEKKLIKQNCH